MNRSFCRARRALPGLAALILFLPLPGLADAYFDEGVKLYQKKNYRQAAGYFEQSIKNAPWESATFFCGLKSVTSTANIAMNWINTAKRCRWKKLWKSCRHSSVNPDRTRLSV